jgi:hypothetical protein
MATQPQAIQLQLSVKPAQLLIGTAAVIALLFAMVTISTSSIVRAQNEASVNQQNTQQTQPAYTCNDGSKASGNGNTSTNSQSNDTDKNWYSNSSARRTRAHAGQSNHSSITQTDSNYTTNITKINRYNYHNSFNKNNGNGNALGSFNGNALGSFNNNKLNSGNTDINVRNSFNDESVTIKDSFKDQSTVIKDNYVGNTVNTDLSTNLDVVVKDSFNTQNNNALVVNN